MVALPVSPEAVPSGTTAVASVTATAGQGQAATRFHLDQLLGAEGAQSRDRPQETSWFCLVLRHGLYIALCVLELAV